MFFFFFFQMNYSRLAFLALRRIGTHGSLFLRWSSTARPIYYQSVSRYSNNVALIDQSATYTYGQLYSLSRQLSRRLLPLCRPPKSTDDTTSSSSSRRNMQIGVLCPNDVSFVVAMWASWMVGATVVPLSSLHPPSSLAYFLSDAQCRAVIVGDDHSHELIKTAAASTKSPTQPSIVAIDRATLSSKITNEDITDDLVLSTTGIDRSNALIIYTSGTSGRPKGCVLTFDTVQAHVNSMIKAWQWTRDDGRHPILSAAKFHCLSSSHSSCFTIASCSWLNQWFTHASLYWCNYYHASQFRCR